MMKQIVVEPQQQQSTNKWDGKGAISQLQTTTTKPKTPKQHQKEYEQKLLDSHKRKQKMLKEQQQQKQQRQQQQQNQQNQKQQQQQPPQPPKIKPNIQQLNNKITYDDNINENMQISTKILDDLASRFIINIPIADRNDFIRICFQLELAHWFYIDFLSKQNDQGAGSMDYAYVKGQTKRLNWMLFAKRMFQHVPFLAKHLRHLDQILEDFSNYKIAVPTYGCILMSPNEEHILLAESFNAPGLWVFPKGKINQNESPVRCAIREVLEEISYDVSMAIDSQIYIDNISQNHYTRLFLIFNVPMTVEFKPRTRYEIRECRWFRLCEFPKNRWLLKNQMALIYQSHTDLHKHSFFLIYPIVFKLLDYQQKASDLHKRYPNVSQLNHFKMLIKSNETVNYLSVTNDDDDEYLVRERTNLDSDNDNLTTTSSTTIHPIIYPSSTSPSSSSSSSQINNNNNADCLTIDLPNQQSKSTSSSNVENKTNSAYEMTKALRRMLNLNEKSPPSSPHI